LTSKKGHLKRTQGFKKLLLLKEKNVRTPARFYYKGKKKECHRRKELCISAGVICSGEEKLADYRGRPAFPYRTSTCVTKKKHNLREEKSNFHPRNSSTKRERGAELGPACKGNIHKEDL